MVALLLILFGVVLRVFPHPANVAPIAALALFGGVYLKPRYAFFVPLGAVVLSDIAIGFDSLASRAMVYGAFMLVSLIGLAVRKRKNAVTVVLGSIGGSLTFYLVTNFAYFYPLSLYPHTLAGVSSSYYNALPFFRYTLLGDLFYVGVFFGVSELALYMGQSKTRPAPAIQ